MKKEDFNVFIPYTFAVSTETTGFDIFVYSWLSVATYNTLIDLYAFTPESLSVMIFGNTKKKKQVAASLEKMPVGYKEENVYCFKHADFKVDGGYVALAYSYINKVFEEGGVSWSKLLKLTISIQAGTRRDLKTNESHYYLNDHPQGWYAAILGVKQNMSIQQYIKKLEELKIIYVRRSDVPHVNNLMGLYEYRDWINSYADQLREYHIKKKSSSSNSKRSLMQKYNQLRNGRQYDAETVAQIRTYILEYNAEQERMQREHPDDDYLSNIKDMSVFNLT